MKMNAKVSLQSVKSFSQAVIAIRDYSSQFDKFSSYFEDFERELSEKIASLRAIIEKMRTAHKCLDEKMIGIKRNMDDLANEIDTLEEHLSSLETELSNTPSSITMSNFDGEDISIPNPAYSLIDGQITSIRIKRDTKKIELMHLQQRHERINSLIKRIEVQTESVNGAIYSLEEKKMSCKKLVSEIEGIKTSNQRNGNEASDKLKKIEEIVTAYMRIKMKYDNVAANNSKSSFKSALSGGININININKTPPDDSVAISSKLFSKDEIEKHKIKFDINGRVCQYDEKSFGGKYNSYETRISRTSVDNNPVIGYYEGERGESKFIPSDRSAEGIVVKEILEIYGCDGIEYRNAEPDFEPCSEAVVRIEAMSENRENYSDVDGIPTLGNFTQADIACAKLWNTINYNGKSDWYGRDVLEYRKSHKLTWHEKCDTETMVLVRYELNDFFRHSGGCSECRVRDAELKGGEFDE